MDLKIQGRLVRIARLADEGFEFVEDPSSAIAELRDSGRRVDLFTFSQRMPHTSPLYAYPMVWDNVAALPLSTFDHWWNKQIDGKTRNMVRRGEKKGLIVREATFDHELAKGIWEIYNECPLRQGRPFPHYGKDPESVYQMSATFLPVSVFIGAYLDQQLVGFAKLTYDQSRAQAAVMHILAMVQHRDKAVTNALLAQSVKSCAQRSIPYLVYSNFAYAGKKRDSLADFKESNGFSRVDIPRYYVPLTGIGRIAYRLGLHQSFVERVPEPVVTKLRDWRNAWYLRRTHSTAQSS